MTSPINPSRYVRNPDVILRDEDEDGALLFNPDTNQVLVLNATAVCVWKQCDGTRDVPALIAAVKTEFEAVPEATVEADVETFVTRMAAGGFLGQPHA